MSSIDTAGTSFGRLLVAFQFVTLWKVKDIVSKSERDSKYTVQGKGREVRKCVHWRSETCSECTQLTTTCGEL